MRRVPLAVAFERVAVPVELKAVDLDDESLLRPEEVGGVPADLHVGPREREARLAKQELHPPFGLAARPGRAADAVELGAQRSGAMSLWVAVENASQRRFGDEVERVGLGDRAFELVAFGLGGEVEEGPGRRGDRDSGPE